MSTLTNSQNPNRPVASGSIQRIVKVGDLQIVFYLSGQRPRVTWTFDDETARDQAFDNVDAIQNEAVVSDSTSSPVGVNGTKGADGSKGSKGAAGDKGESGDKGQKGEPG